MVKIELIQEHDQTPVETARLKDAAAKILASAGYQLGELSLAIIDDQAMQVLNNRHLQHDYPTDVLSFLLEEQGDTIHGEVIASVDTAARKAIQYGWQRDDEVLLYIIHGVLHLIGYDDHSSADRAAMRKEETKILAEFDLSYRHDDELTSDTRDSGGEV